MFLGAGERETNYCMHFGSCWFSVWFCVVVSSCRMFNPKTMWMIFMLKLLYHAYTSGAAVSIPCHHQLIAISFQLQATWVQTYLSFGGLRTVKIHRSVDIQFITIAIVASSLQATLLVQHFIHLTRTCCLSEAKTETYLWQRRVWQIKSYWAQ